MKGTCQVCGCTNTDCSQCIEASGEPCFWVDDTQELCSRCADEDPDFYLDEEEKILDEICPNCKRRYDPIDLEYQICHHCNFNNNKE